MKKLIDLPDDVRWKLEALAVDEKKDLKTFIQDILIKVSHRVDIVKQFSGKK